MPHALFGQLLLALVAAMALAISLSFWFLTRDRVKEFENFMGAHVTLRVVSLISILDSATPKERIRLVRNFNIVGTRYIRLNQPWEKPTGNTTQKIKKLTETIRDGLGPRYPVQIVFFGKSDQDKPSPPRDTPPPESQFTSMRAVIQVRLHDRTVVTITQFFLARHGNEPVILIGSLALMGIVIALLTGLVVRRLTRPLSTLADAAGGLALNLDQPPVPVTGSAEVASAAAAFNAMQSELKKMLDTRSQALAGVSHDLRLPITRMRLRTERLENPELKTEISGDLDEMDEMIATTLDFLRAGKSSEKPVRLNLQALVELIVAETEEAGATVELKGNTPAQTWTRPIALKRCLANLMNNAHRYGDGRIDVEVRPKKPLIEIRVGDRGPGIPQEEHERVFEPFVRLDKSRSRDTGGTGLGLSIARAIARQEGGDIRLETRPGGGLLAILSIPASPVPG